MYKVLLLDDEPWELIGLEKTFKWADMGFEIEDMLSDAIDAFDVICAKKPHVVFTDIRMPEIDGIQLMKMVREQGLDTEFVVISGFAEFSYAQEALRQGAFDYWVKPVLLEDADRLLERLVKHLEEKEAQARTADAGNIRAQEDGDLLLELIDYVRGNYRTELSLKDISQRFHMNLTYCSEYFKKAAGKNFSDYVKDLRMKEAGELLTHTGLTIAAICDRVGYRDYYYFNKVFKRHFGITPARFRTDYKKTRKIPC